TGEKLRAEGAEFGATTGRPRRCGWLDLVALNYTSRLNGFTEIAVTKLDVMAVLDELKVCTAYDLEGGKQSTRFPTDLRTLSQAKPVYETLPGFSGDLREADSISDLPQTAQDYLDFMSAQLGVPISVVGTGPKREETLVA
ncbi:adenylosuccinate synthetase, partial [Rubrivirga sp.]|uniref:adenylosuccinate synthetase n=1 Tax=Rubrivirga sp. TaxID=1885344 RepID=UPI003C73FBFD